MPRPRLTEPYTCPVCGDVLPREAFGTHVTGYRRSACKRCDSRAVINRRKKKTARMTMRRAGIL